MRKKKWYKITSIICLSLILLSIIVYFLQHAQLFLVLNGEPEMNVPVYSPFEDPGAYNRMNKKTVLGEGEVDTSKLGEYKLEYKAFLQKIERTVTVVDDTAPSVVLNAPSYIQVPVGTDISADSAVAHDNFDQNITAVISQGIPAGQAGTFEVIYSATDSSGNVGEVRQTVNVVDDDFHYENEIHNNVSLAQSRVDKIIAYLNELYRSMVYLDARDMSGFYSEDGAQYAYKMQKGLEYLITTRNLSGNSLYLDDCSYDITIDRTDYAGTGLCVRVYEDSTVKFHYLNGEESKQHNVLSKFYFDYNGDLTQVYREEGFYLAFDKEDMELGDNYKDELDKLYMDYLEAYMEQQDNRASDRSEVNSGKAQGANLSASNPYDRDAAAEYADDYAMFRNWRYPDYESNCMNFVSQVIHAGGVPIDHTGTYQWKNYDLAEDHSDSETGFTYEFIRISYFNKYLENTADPPKMVVERDLNLWLGEKGDIVYVGMDGYDYDDYPHVVIIAAPVYNEEGELIDFLIDGNTNDQYHYPLSASCYIYRRLAKVHGYN
ncbi:MAG: amidase domain-containing protein [Oscillospiraceae bacterium]|nr:amidase domain-containing protein [Oscillospiraceae bacterium]MBR0450620.1 amidase domain-containing protein [Oscillospiraceae bacterium]